jgi:hypothetical protein
MLYVSKWQAFSQKLKLGNQMLGVAFSSDAEKIIVGNQAKGITWIKVCMSPRSLNRTMIPDAQSGYGFNLEVKNKGISIFVPLGP